MDIDNRKLKILAAVVDEYIRTGEPVGSKVIASMPDIKVSSATIRNDMAMLEQLGLLEQPHTSAGRVPTFNGYKLYIDKLMTPESLSEDERIMLDTMLGDDTLSEDELMQNAASALAELTQCAAIAANTAASFSVISKVEVIPTGKRLYVILLITSNGNIKNKACRLQFDLTDEQLDFFTSYMQENLQGVAIESLSEDKMQELVTALGAYMVSLSPLLQSVFELSADLKKQDVVISGERNLVSRADLDKNDIVRFFEKKNDLSALLDASFSGIQVMFGKENGEFIIGNSSMVMANIKKGNREAGSLGIIGPMRIDYAKIIPYVEYLTQRISNMITDSEDNTDGICESNGKETDNG